MRKTVLLFLAAALLLSACGKGKYADSRFAGSWTAQTVSAEETDFLAADLVGEFRIDLAEDGTCVVTSGGETESDTWEETDKGVTIHYPDETVDYMTETESGLTLARDGVTFHFRKLQAETEPGAETESGAEAEPGAETESGAETETGAEAEPGAETESGAETEPGAETESAAGMESGAESE